jgi:hypothetical protein
VHLLLLDRSMKIQIALLSMDWSILNASLEPYCRTVGTDKSKFRLSTSVCATGGHSGTIADEAVDVESPTALIQDKGIVTKEPVAALVTDSMPVVSAAVVVSSSVASSPVANPMQPAQTDNTASTASPRNYLHFVS